MKKLTLILLSLLTTTLMAQNLDVTAYSQNITLVDTPAIQQEIPRQLATYPSISESYEIPAYSLYQRYWDTANLRSQLLEIPFSNDRLMLMLVQDANNPFVMPCQFDRVRTAYGETKNGNFHPGIDLKTEPQTLVKSCFDGVVRMAKYYGDYGITVVVRHYNGLETVYAHLDKVSVKPNQIVKAGQVIGTYLAAYGFDIDFAPVADVNTNPTSCHSTTWATGNPPPRNRKPPLPTSNPSRNKNRNPNRNSRAMSSRRQTQWILTPWHPKIPAYPRLNRNLSRKRNPRRPMPSITPWPPAKTSTASP